MRIDYHLSTTRNHFVKNCLMSMTMLKNHDYSYFAQFYEPVVVNDPLSILLVVVEISGILVMENDGGVLGLVFCVALLDSVVAYEGILQGIVCAETDISYQLVTCSVATVLLHLLSFLEINGDGEGTSVGALGTSSL